MIIQSIELYHVAMPLVYPFRTAFADESHIESVLVRMMSDEGYGWGETSPWQAPTYSSEWAGGVFRVLRKWLAPRLVGQNVASGAELQALLAPFKGNPFAKAALDLAWWDLLARSRSLPLWQVLGGASPTVDVGADFGVMETLPALHREIAQAHAAGFKRIKLKYRPGWELEMIASVRERFPDLVFHVDCNSAYTLNDLPMFRELDRFGLAMIEQPLAHDDLADHAELQRHLQTPICLDESIVSLAKVQKAIRLGACRWVNIKLGRVGGVTSAMAIQDACREADISCWVGGMLESAVGQAHSIAFATRPHIGYPSDIFPTSRFYAQDLGTPAIALSGPSQVTAPAGPGIGCEPDPGELLRLLVHKAVVC